MSMDKGLDRVEESMGPREPGVTFCVDPETCDHQTHAGSFTLDVFAKRDPLLPDSVVDDDPTDD